jgi:DNA-binding GntR family transcriptional regulator
MNSPRIGQARRADGIVQIKKKRNATASLGGAGGIKPPARVHGTLNVDLADTLRRLITGGVFKAGNKLTERELCERLGASRPSVREALRQLKAECLVDIIPNRGPVVRELTEPELLDLWEVRTSLMVLIARRFAERGTLQQIDGLAAVLREFEQALKSGDIDLIKSTKAKFYEAFLAGSDSGTANWYFRQLNARISYIWASSLLLPGRPAESIKELNSLVKALRRRDQKGSEQAIGEHAEHARAVAIYGLRAIKESQRLAKRTRRRQPVEK